MAQSNWRTGWWTQVCKSERRISERKIEINHITQKNKHTHTPRMSSKTDYACKQVARRKDLLTKIIWANVDLESNFLFSHQFLTYKKSALRFTCCRSKSCFASQTNTLILICPLSSGTTQNAVVLGSLPGNKVHTHRIVPRPLIKHVRCSCNHSYSTN